MRGSYLDYAMSVIVARALPDARDGLKPVQRRILYAMHDMGLRPGTPYKKSARIVGEVLGKYHPHGDSAVYDAMARMAQDFCLRYPLVDGQGNFGSIDGDAPAAMRYTEARLARIAEALLADIEKDTVDWTDNFDGSLQEPAVLPALLPNLLLNGSSGIAVGMATNIPPHNLGELADAIVHLIDRWAEVDEVTVDELMQFVQGPDFPTGGLVLGREEIKLAYGTGKGRLTMRAVTRIEEMGGGRHRIIVTEIPYQINKTTILERIAELVRDGRLSDISDLRDESDRTGHAHRDRAQARRRRPQGAQPALQVHAAAEHLRRQHAGAGGRRAAPAEPEARAAALRRAPHRRHHPAHGFPAGPGARARAHPGRAAHRAAVPGRGHPDHPRGGQRRRGPRAS